MTGTGVRVLPCEKMFKLLRELCYNQAEEADARVNVSPAERPGELTGYRSNKRQGESMGFLKEMKRDLVDPIKSFSEEVCDDTLGDAKRFYTARARAVRRSARLAEQRAQEKREATRRSQEEMKKTRKAMLKRAEIILAALILLGLVVISLILYRCW